MKIVSRFVIPTVGIFLILLFYFGILVPPQFKGEKRIDISIGDSANKVSNILFKEGVIRSPQSLLLLIKMLGKEKDIQPGTIVFRESPSVFKVISLLTGHSREKQITLIEGWTNHEIASYLDRENIVKKEDFIKASKNFEGYLFPDTYRVFEGTSSDELVQLFRDTFAEKTRPLIGETEAKKKQLSDIVIMASLIEKESSGSEDRNIISGILWKRLDAGMPFQVDATITYLTGRASKDLTTADLNIDSPYNTYIHIGLPKSPIGNPGLVSLKAALSPQKSPYWFYLHDREGKPHYAKTLEEHAKNKQRYLRSSSY